MPQDNFNLSEMTINGVLFTLKDNAAQNDIQNITSAIITNNASISERINNLNYRSFDSLIKISSNNDTEILNINDGLYKIQYVTTETVEEEIVETVNNTAILCQTGINQYLIKDGQISSRTKTNNTWGNWTSTISLALSSEYEMSSDSNNDLDLESGDTYEEAFAKIEKAIFDIPKYDSTHKLSGDLIEDGTTNKIINVKPDWNAASGNAAEILNKPTSLPANGGNADTVNGHTVNSDVPANAVFTDNDTTYQFTQSGNTLKMGTNGGTKSNIYTPTIPTSLPANGGNADTVNSHTVNTDVPTNAVFTDTTYSNATTSIAGLMSASDKEKLNGIAEGATAVSEQTVSNWGFTKNTGTVTGIKMNNTNKTPTNGVVDLGTVITSHQNISGKVDTSTKVNGHALTSDITLTKSDIGLGNVTNDEQVKRTEMGANNGVATLDANGKVPSSQLPSYVDDIIEGYLYNNKFYEESTHVTIITGERGKIYVDKSTDTTWRWSGSQYTQIKGDLAIGTSTGTAADGKIVNDHINNTSNPHGVTKAQVDLGNVVNTGDSATPVEGGTTKFTTGGAYTELAKKVDKVSGKGLSTNDYTNDEKNKLAGIAEGAEVNVQSDWNATSGDAFIKNKPTIPTAVAVKGDAESSYRTGNVNITPANIGLGNVGNFKAVSTVANQGLSTTEKSNARTNIGAGTSSFSGDYNDLSNKPTIPTAVAVKGDAESSYRTGNVNITPANIGLGNVGNFKAVSTVANQGLSNTEKANARTNIGAGTSSFSGNYNDLTNKPTIPDVTDYVDEEDLTSVNVGGTDVIRFKDKLNNHLTYSGLGRVYLRKNIVNGVNVLTQEMINNTNTIYIIQYDYDLLGETITVPAGCVLQFEGGNLKNGCLTNIVSNTIRYCEIKYVGNSNNPIFTNLLLIGKFNGVGYDWMTNDTNTNDDWLCLSNLCQFVKGEIVNKNSLSISRWNNPFYGIYNIPVMSSYLSMNGIYAVNGVNIDGHGATINIIADEPSRCVYSVATTYGLQTAPFLQIETKTNFATQIKFVNLNIIDDASINGAGADLTNPETINNGTENVRLHSNFLHCLWYVSVNREILFENFSYNGKFQCFGIESNQALNSVGYFKNCNVYSSAYFCLEFFCPNSDRALDAVYYTNCKFKTNHAICSNAAVSKEEIFDNCVFDGNGKVGRHVSETTLLKKVYYNDCTFLYGIAPCYAGDWSQSNYYTELNRCRFSFEGASLVDIQSYVDVNNPGITKYNDCTFDSVPDSIMLIKGNANTEVYWNNIIINSYSKNIFHSTPFYDGSDTEKEYTFVVNNIKFIRNETSSDMWKPMPPILAVSKASRLMGLQGIDNPFDLCFKPLYQIESNDSYYRELLYANSVAYIPYMDTTNCTIVDGEIVNTTSELTKTPYNANNIPFYSNWSITYILDKKFTTSTESDVPAQYHRIRFNIGTTDFSIFKSAGGNLICLDVKSGVVSTQQIIKIPFLEGIHAYTLSFGGSDVYMYIDGKKVPFGINSVYSGLKNVDFNGGKVNNFRINLQNEYMFGIIGIIIKPWAS